VKVNPLLVWLYCDSVWRSGTYYLILGFTSQLIEDFKTKADCLCRNQKVLFFVSMPNKLYCNWPSQSFVDLEKPQLSAIYRSLN